MPKKKKIPASFHYLEHPTPSIYFITQAFPLFRMTVPFPHYAQTKYLILQLKLPGELQFGLPPRTLGQKRMCMNRSLSIHLETPYYR